MYKILLYLFFLISLIDCSVYAQSPGSTIDVQHYNFNIQLSDSTNLIKGRADIKVRFLKGASSFKINLSDNMQVIAITENGAKLPFSQGSDDVNIAAIAAEGTEHTYTITYQGIPADGLIISNNKFSHRTFFGDNWPDRAHNWLPCVDSPADKATVDFVVTAPDHYQVVSNGLKIEEVSLPNHLKLTHWKETVPIPTKVMVIGAAGFAVEHTGDVGSIPVYSYVFPENKAAGFQSYLGAKDILAFFVGKIGPYPYGKLANVQSETIFDAMENAGAIFYEEKSVGGSKTEELMAHEIAHQWFGDAVTEKSFAEVWLSEGFATYMANTYLENKYGPGSLKKHLLQDRAQVLNLENNKLAPVVDTTVKGDYIQLLNANSYAKGGWVLHMLHRQLGDDAFWKGIRAYYARYNGGNANTDGFREMMEQASGQNLQQFFKQWLYTAGSPDINYGWNYDPNKKTVNIIIEQKQDSLFELPLEFLIGGKAFTVQVKDKITRLQLPYPEKPGAVIIDPGVNILAHFENINLSPLLLKNK